jgi:predicted NAD-dependent protein-ADP-ribosyltransferase YbiA (DUF1768 family)
LRIRFDQNKLLAINKKGLLIPAGFHKSSKFWTGIFWNWEPSVLKCNGSHYLQMLPYILNQKPEQFSAPREQC